MGWQEYIKEGTVKPHWSESLLTEEDNKLNVATLPLAKARKYAEEQFKKAGKSLDEVLPDFDKNYMLLQKSTKKAKDVPRIEMPVIEPEDMKKFQSDLNKGKVDIFKPYAEKEWSKIKMNDPFPKDLDSNKGKEWVVLGTKDGDNKDDIVKAKMGAFPVSKIYPSQSQIWLEKLISNVVKFGPAKQGSPVTKTTIIVTKDKYILDGHHRFGQAMLSDPSLKMTSLFIPIDFDQMLKIGRSYGNALGHKQKQ